MTREEAKDKASKAPYPCRGNIYKFINNIYDDIESRVCENCKYFNLMDIDSNGFSNCLLGVETNYKYSVCFSFGCNDFERKLEPK